MFGKLNPFSFSKKSFGGFANFALLGENNAAVQEVESDMYNLSLVFINSLIT